MNFILFNSHQFFYLSQCALISFIINITMIARIDEFNLFMLNYVAVQHMLKQLFTPTWANSCRVTYLFYYYYYFMLIASAVFARVKFISFVSSNQSKITLAIHLWKLRHPRLKIILYKQQRAPPCPNANLHLDQLPFCLKTQRNF